MTVPASRLRKTLLTATLAAAVLLCGSPANAGTIDGKIIFNQAGHVDIIFTGNAGGFDHILEPVIVGGGAPFWAFVPISGNPWIIGTDGTSQMTLVGDAGSPHAQTGMFYNWGYFDILGGEEITLRLTNVMTERIGGSDPDSWGTIVSQLFSGSSAVNNTLYSGGSVLGGTPGAPDPSAPLGGGYTNVTFVDPYTIDVAFEDLDPNRDIASRWQNMSVRFVLTPVPDAGSTLLLLGAGLAGLGAARRRMRK